MKKLILAAAILLIPICTPNHAQALPLHSGTAILDFAALGIGTGSTSLDWAVYAPGDTGAVAGVSADYTYQYTLHGWSGYAGTYVSDIYRAPAFATGTGTSSSGTTATVSAIDYGTIVPGGLGIFGFDTDLATPFNSPSQTTTGWFTSSLGPVNSTFDLSLNRADWVASGATIMTDGTGPGGISGPPLPGVPEPETWALLLSMMAFITVGMRRRQDEDKPMETSITA